MSAADLDIKRYTPSQIIRVNSQFESWEKPISVVRIWRREIRVNNHLKEVQERRPMVAEQGEVPWRRDVGDFYEHARRLESKEGSVKAEMTITLNKLCASNSSKLQPKLLEIATSSEENMGLLVNDLLQKACKEKVFASVYANVCQWLIEEYLHFQFRNDCDQKNNNCNKFRRTLLNNFQDIFEASTDGITGCCVVLAELFNRNIISHKLLMVCLDELITPILNDDSLQNELRLQGAILILKNGDPRIFNVKYSPDLEPILSKLESILGQVCPAIKQEIHEVFHLRSRYINKFLSTNSY